MPVTMSAIATPSLNGGPSASPVMLEMHEPRDGVDDVGEGRPRPPRPRLAEARDRAIHQPRPSLGDSRISQAQSFHGAGPEVLDEHIGAVEQTFDYGAAGLEIEGQALLVSIDAEEVRALRPDERRSPRARVVTTARLFDFDDARSHVGELHRAVRAGKDTREIHDHQPVKRTGTRASILQRHTISLCASTSSSIPGRIDAPAIK
jgi:hypothetical protein